MIIMIFGFFHLFWSCFEQLKQHGNFNRFHKMKIIKFFFVVFILIIRIEWILLLSFLWWWLFSMNGFGQFFLFLLKFSDDDFYCDCNSYLSLQWWFKRKNDWIINTVVCDKSISIILLMTISMMMMIIMIIVCVVDIVMMIITFDFSMILFLPKIISIMMIINNFIRILFSETRKKIDEQKKIDNDDHYRKKIICNP